MIMNEVEAAASSMDAAQAKESEIVLEKKASKKSQEIKARKELCTGRLGRKGKLSCCGMCPCQHKRECPIGIQQEKLIQENLMATLKGKMSTQTQLGVLEALQIVGDPVQRTETKRKT